MGNYKTTIVTLTLAFFAACAESGAPPAEQALEAWDETDSYVLLNDDAEPTEVVLDRVTSTIDEGGMSYRVELTGAGIGYDLEVRLDDNGEATFEMRSETGQSYSLYVDERRLEVEGDTATFPRVTTLVASEDSTLDSVFQRNNLAIDDAALLEAPLPFAYPWDDMPSHRLALSVAQRLASSNPELIDVVRAVYLATWRLEILEQVPGEREVIDAFHAGLEPIPSKEPDGSGSSKNPECDEDYVPQTKNWLSDAGSLDLSAGPVSVSMNVAKTQGSSICHPAHAPAAGNKIGLSSTYGSAGASAGCGSGFDFIYRLKGKARAWADNKDCCHADGAEDTTQVGVTNITVFNGQVAVQGRLASEVVDMVTTCEASITANVQICIDFDGFNEFETISTSLEAESACNK